MAREFPRMICITVVATVMLPYARSSEGVVRKRAVDAEDATEMRVTDASNDRGQNHVGQSEEAGGYKCVLRWRRAGASRAV